MMASTILVVLTCIVPVLTVALAALAWDVEQ